MTERKEPALIASRPLQGKLALVTGGSRGIGAGISRKLAAWGCELWIGYVSRDLPAQALSEELRAQGATVHLVKGDLGDPEEVVSMFRAIRHGCEHLDILVHNAASAVFRKLADASLEHWEYVQNTNARSTLLLAQHARPMMTDRKGRFITVTNNTTVRHVGRAGLFGAAKASLEMLTKYLAVELAQDGIVANCVRPGLVATGVFEVRPDFNVALEAERKESPWKGRVTTPEDVGNAVALLCLEEADWICGQVIDIDGGYNLWR